MSAYYAGKGCMCVAKDYSECACDADWTDPTVHRLQEEIDALKAEKKELEEEYAILYTAAEQLGRIHERLVHE